MNTPTTVAALRAPQQTALAEQGDQRIDMFSLRGFELAQRIAKAFATSDAVPAQFRSQVLKKVNGNETWIDNPSALGNCLVAIETARAVGMSITSVMQHANIIEGRLSWSAQFVIAAINASGRFTPLRFDIKSRGLIKAKYREKQGWNKAKGGYDFIDREVEVEDLVCVAWAYIKENGRTTSERVESAPVSMRMAVEEGWYGKSGSKWQTEMKHQMLQYRAGSFFGRIHAPDVVMGMGRTTEELQDMTTIDVASDGTVGRVYTTTELRPDAPVPMAEVVGRDYATHHEAEPVEFDTQAFINRINECGDLVTLQLMSDEAEELPEGEGREAVMAALLARDGVLANQQVMNERLAAQQQANANPATGRRTRAATTSME
jgi:hypothetical protein